MIRVFYFLLGIFFLAALNLVIPRTSVTPNALYFAVVAARDSQTNSILLPSVRNVDLFRVFPKGVSALLRYNAPILEGETLIVGVGRSRAQKEKATIEVSGYYDEEIVLSKLEGRMVFDRDQVQKIHFKKNSEK